MIKGEIKCARDGRETHSASQWISEYCDFKNQLSIYSEPAAKFWIKRIAESNIHTSNLLEGNIHVEPGRLMKVVMNKSSSKWKSETLENAPRSEVNTDRKGEEWQEPEILITYENKKVKLMIKYK